MENRRATLDYLSDHLGALARVAKDAKFDMLAYLIEMAQLETENLKGGPTNIVPMTRREPPKKT